MFEKNEFIRNDITIIILQLSKSTNLSAEMEPLFLLNLNRTRN